jgi:hypothetical protein
VSYRHAGEKRHPEEFEIPGFRVAQAIDCLPGMRLIYVANFLVSTPAATRKSIQKR